MRILCITGYYKPAYVYGGPVSSVSALCEGMARAGAQVTVFTTNANGAGKALAVPTNHLLELDGVNVCYFPRTYSFLPTPFYSPALGRACQANIKQFDAVYFCATWTYPMLAGASAALKADIPYVVSPRGSFMIWSMSQKAFKKHLYLALTERHLINGAAAIHCTCQLEQEQLKKWHFQPPAVVIPNGLDMGPFQQLPERGKLRQSLGISASGTLSLFVGRLHKEKRIRLMIEVFVKVAEMMPDAHLLIVGPEGDGSGKIAEEQVRELGLSGRVHFAGMLTGASLMQAYADADMLVLLSHRESFGMVVVEAMAAALPVLVAYEVGLAEEVAQASAGCATPVDLDQVAQAWREMLTKPELRQAMGQCGKALVQQRFRSEVVATQMLELLTCISAGPSKSQSRRIRDT